MEKFLEFLKTPECWFGIIILGIIVNVTAYYLRKYISSCLAKISKSYSNYRLRRNEEIEKESDILAKNSTLFFCKLIKWQHKKTLINFILGLCLLLVSTLSNLRQGIDTIPLKSLFWPSMFVAELLFLSKFANKQELIVKKAEKKMTERIKKNSLN